MFSFQIGFLRLGNIITEKCPKELISAFGCVTLEEVFFKLSEAQSKSLDNLNEYSTNANTEDAVNNDAKFEPTSSSTTSFGNFESTDGSSEVD